MGIVGLWDALSAEISTCELTKLVVHEGFKSNKKRKYRLGIDANIWFYLCTTPSTAVASASGKGSELNVFFNKLSRLAKLPIEVVFVFDGKNKPSIKRGVQVINREHSLYKDMILFIEAFGFCHHSAPAEAEAELSYMNKIGLIDAVVTDDSDALLFGANTIIKNWNVHKDGDFVRFRKQEVGSMSRGSLILFGILMGGDYDNKKGLSGCGKETALALVAEGFGNQLCNAASCQSEPGLHTYLNEWRNDIRTFLRVNRKGTMRSRRPGLADSLPESFPDLHIVQLYLNPIISSHKTLSELVLECRLPNVTDITRLCELHFNWGNRQDIQSKFATSVVPSILTFILAQDALHRLKLHSATNNDLGHSQLPSVFHLSHTLFPNAIIMMGKQKNLNGISQHKISVSAAYIHQIVLISLCGLHDVLNTTRITNQGDSDSNTTSPTQAVVIMNIPTILLVASLLQTGPPLPLQYPLPESTLLSSTALDASVSSVRAAFLMNIDIQSLSWLTQAYVNSHKASTDSILDIVESLFTTIGDPSNSQQLVLELLRRYINMCRNLPPSIPSTYTLEPVVRVLKKLLSHKASSSSQTSPLLQILQLASESSGSSTIQKITGSRTTLSSNSSLS